MSNAVLTAVQHGDQRHTQDEPNPEHEIAQALAFEYACSHDGHEGELKATEQQQPRGNEAEHAVDYNLVHQDRYAKGKVLCLACLEPCILCSNVAVL